ncbi:MAG: thioredoxin domain-containing protein [Deltaproteobacteria bacterium]|nr:thioredoxin domain-containing protein [Deltaproteobacteria bacterium]
MSGHVAHAEAPRRPRLAIAIGLLLGLAIASNLYLTQLYVRVHANPGAKVDSFCAVSEKVNCVTVAQSRYSALSGVPMAVLGAEFFALALLALVASAWGRWRVRHWDSVLFAQLLLGLPISMAMAHLSAFQIQSVCLLCVTVYGSHFLALAILIVVRRQPLKEFVRLGPRELKKWLGTGAAKGFVTLVLAVGLSQFLWAPKVFGVRASDADPVSGDPFAGLIQGPMTLGPPDAPIKIEEFSDYECPICARGHEVLVQVLKRNPKVVHFRHRDYPLDQACNRKMQGPLHQHACRAADYARCAAEQKKFWPFVALLFHRQDALAPEELRAHAKTVGLDLKALEQCVGTAETRQAVLDDVEEGIKRDVKGTPTYVINGETIVGPHDVEFWETKIAELLKKK